MVLVAQQLEALQLAHVSVAQLALSEHEHDTIVPVPAFLAVRPAERPGHAEVQVHGRVACVGIATRSRDRDDEPLAVPPRVTELPATQYLLQSIGADVVEHAGVYDVDATDSAPDRVVGEHPTEAFDIR